MEATTRQFTGNARQALKNDNLRAALDKLSHGFPYKRLEAAARLPEFEALRDQSRDIKAHVLENLDFYLQQFESKVIEQGGQVHWAKDAAEARDIILAICQEAGAETVTKSKSMIGEEIAINGHLEANGVRPVETDLGEYIIQLRKEPPSHLIAPAIHLSMDQVADTFKDKHREFAADRPLDQPRELLEEARTMLRREFLAADVGLTGANLLIAETGSIALVTNEGNADLTLTLPNTHIAIASIEKAVPTLEDATTILRVLARSATGQELSVYTTFVSGPKRTDDMDGPENFHVVLLDNGRTQMLGSEFHDMLRCIRCGACLNSCPVYGAIGGHAYGWVYSGPMGSVLMPGILGLEQTGDLPNASTLCGTCESVCPMRIPLPAMLRRWREQQHARRLTSTKSRMMLKLWAMLARRPGLYRAVMGLGVGFMRALAGGRGSLKSLPFAGGWTAVRDLPAPEGKTFTALWKERRK